MLQVSGKCSSNSAGSETAREGATLDRNLAAYIGDKPADSSVLQIFRRVLETLHAIHMAGASHLPLSPRTIRFDDFGHPQIQPLQRPHESADTVAFGSVKYSVPEAFVGTESPSCESADCYLLGFMFYEILIGKHSFVAQFASLENGPPSLWLKWHADKTAKARPLTELRPNLGHFARLIDGMMEKDPRKRISSISQILAGFANVEAQTAHNVNAPGGRATVPEAPNFYKLVQRKLASTAAWFGKQLGAFRKPRVGARLLVLAAAIGVTAVLLHREAPSPHVRQPMPAAPPPTVQPATKASNPVLHVPTVTPSTGEIAPTPPEPEPELQIESRLNSSVFLLLDDLRPVALSRDTLFTQKIIPGTHKVTLFTRSKSFLKLPLTARPDGILLIERPIFRSLRYVILASSAKSAKLYASPEARAGLPGQAYEPVPGQGRLVGSDKVVTVLLSQDPKREVHLDPLPARSIKIVLEPGQLRSLIPVEISANVPDAFIVINGETLTRQLEKGVTVVRLHPGEYHVKLVHPGYQDSAVQKLVITGNEQRQQMDFALSPIVRESTLEVSFLPAGVEILVDGKTLGVTESSAGFKAKINPGIHTVTFRRPNFESLTLVRNFPANGSVNINGQGMRPLGK